MKKTAGLLGAFCLLATSAFAQTPVRIAELSTGGMLSANSVSSTALADSVSFPANFAASGSDPNSVVAPCIGAKGPLQNDYYEFLCTSSSGSAPMGSVMISTSGTPTFSTAATPPVVAAITSAQPGANGGNINVPSGTVNGDLLVMLVDSSVACLNIPGWNQPTIGNVTNGSINPFDSIFYCLYDRIANSEPVAYSYAATGAYPAIGMMDIKNAPANIATALDVVAGATSPGSTTPTIPALNGLSTSQDLLIGGILSYNYSGGSTVTFTPPGSITQLMNLAYTSGTSAGNYIGNVVGNTTSTSAISGSYASSVPWAAYAITIAPRTLGGTGSAPSCAAGNRVDIVGPSYFTVACPITLAGHY